MSSAQSPAHGQSRGANLGQGIYVKRSSGDAYFLVRTVDAKALADKSTASSSSVGTLAAPVRIDTGAGGGATSE